MTNVDIYTKIRELVKKYNEEVIEIRRDIHMHPELSYQEVRTAKLVAERLEKLGMEVQTGIAKTGVIGILKGKTPGKTVALRADMDAVAIQEDNDLPFCSVNDGVMHACGHDCHTANLLGVAMILSELKDELNGTVKFIFQPAEEYGHSGSGGDLMVKEGALDNPKVDAAFALHVGTFPLGIVGLSYGTATSYIDSFTLKVKGKNAHSAGPHNGVDSIVVAANIITALQSVLSRNIDPADTATFTLGRIHGGSTSNIIPDLVEIDGMMRCISEDGRNTIKRNIEKISKSIAEGMGGECELVFDEGCVPVVNDKFMTDIVKQTALERYDALKGELKLPFPPNFDMRRLVDVRKDEPGLGGEDFGYISQAVPSTYFLVGAGPSAPLHKPKFMVNENVFEITLDLLASIAVKFLNE